MDDRKVHPVDVSKVEETKTSVPFGNSVETNAGTMVPIVAATPVGGAHVMVASSETELRRRKPWEILEVERHRSKTRRVSVCEASAIAYEAKASKRVAKLVLFASKLYRTPHHTKSEVRAAQTSSTARPRASQRAHERGDARHTCADAKHGSTAGSGEKGKSSVLLRDTEAHVWGAARGLGARAMTNAPRDALHRTRVPSCCSTVRYVELSIMPQPRKATGWRCWQAVSGLIRLSGAAR
jgi:hypothetical protein